MEEKVCLHNTLSVSFVTEICMIDINRLSIPKSIQTGLKLTENSQRRAIPEINVLHFHQGP